jgi:SAM-dependent methyltransferase
MNKEQTPEICGDGHMPFGRRILYILINLWRNMTCWGVHPVVERFYSARPLGTPGLASPSRILTEAFIKSRLPQLITPKRIRVLEIGCGSGRLCSMLAELGYSGEYVGLDIDDRFTHTQVPGFQSNFIFGDAHAFDPGSEKFDLIISVSALEHIPQDALLINKLPSWLAAGGMELHFLPSSFSFLLYLWRGWRQYPLPQVINRFGSDIVATALGGTFTSMLHFTFITVGEILLPFKARKRLRWFYQPLIDRALVLDHFLPLFPSMHVVRRAKTSTNPL